MKVLSSLCLLFFLAGCSFGHKEKTGLTEQGVVQATFVTYLLQTIDQKKGPCEADSTQSACLVVDINYPFITQAPEQGVIDSINHFIKEDIFQYAFVNEKPASFETLIKEISDGYEEILVDFPDYKSPWSLEISSDIIFQSKNFISVATSIFSYTGGAHPNSYLVYKSYNLKTGKAVMLKDILIADFEEELNRSAEIEFRMNHQIPPTRKLSEAGFQFEGDEFQLNDNFAIIDNSLVFYFNSYEIASYAQGPSELELKLTDYVGLINENGILNELKN